MADEQVLEAQRWPDNASLIRAAMDMHVFPKYPQPRVLDATYGKGVWWRKMPEGVLAVQHDLRLDGVDYRRLPEDDDSVDVVWFDPDYVAPGGRSTSTIHDFNDRYGLKGSYESPSALQEMLDEGLTEAARVVAPQGLILMKCMTYVSSGAPIPGEFWSIHHGMLKLGLALEDIWVHIGDPGPQPPDRKCACADPLCVRCAGTGRFVPRQKHARSNSTRLIVFRKPGRRRRKVANE